MNRGILKQAAEPAVRICRESSLTKAHGRSCQAEKGQVCPFLPLSGEDVARAELENRSRDWSFAGSRGQRPEPSESF